MCRHADPARRVCTRSVIAGLSQSGGARFLSDPSCRIDRMSEVLVEVEFPDEERVLELSTGADEIAEWAASADFGSGVLTPFGVLDPAGLSHRGRVDALVAVERTIRHLQAQQQRLLAAIEADPCPPGLRAGDRGDQLRSEYLHKQYVREDVGCALRVSFATAARRLAMAADLTRRFP